MAERPSGSRLEGGNAMTRFQPATVESNAIVRPLCSKCGTTMLLARIEPGEPGFDVRTFECPKCEYSEAVIVKYR
jgi:ribosomal protein S27AE